MGHGRRQIGELARSSRDGDHVGPAKRTGLAKAMGIFVCFTVLAVLLGLIGMLAGWWSTRAFMAVLVSDISGLLLYGRAALVATRRADRGPHNREYYPAPSGRRYEKEEWDAS